jgi:glucose/mannose transport system permease protein
MRNKPSVAARLRAATPLLVTAPSAGLILLFVYGFTAWTVLLSFTDSRMLPRFDSWAGLRQYERLWATPRWHVAVGNLGVYAALFIACALIVGLLLAILVDRQIRAEGFFRTVYLYPMALSSIVAGVAWQWILNPELGIERFVRDWGWTAFRFDWLVNPKMSLYAVVAADVWKASGFVMVMFLAGLRSIDQNLLRAAAIDGAGVFQLYRRVILPALRPVFVSVLLILAQRASTTYDMAVALTGGGPGYSSDLPAVFMVATAFQRNQLGLGSAAAVMMLAAVLAVVLPYFVFELRRQRRA